MTRQTQPWPFGRIRQPDAAWLARTPDEAVLDPDLPIIDTHHHLWDHPSFRYLLPDLLADAATGHNLIATVFEECHAMYRVDGPAEMKPVGEVEFVAGIAAMSESGIYGPTRVAAGIVGYADLALGDRVEPVLEAEIRAGGGRFRGVRFQAAWHDDPIIGNSRFLTGPGAYHRPEVRDGVRRLAAMGLSLDAWVFHHQLGDVVDLARAVPEATIVLCHVGGPLGYGPYAGRIAEVHAEWKASMADLARCPNLYVKLGGHVMRLGAYPYPTDAAPPGSEELARLWRPWIGEAIAMFGADRCLFESNFPVDKMGCTWRTLWNAFKRIAAGASPDEKAALFAGTARRVYRLPA